MRCALSCVCSVRSVPSVLVSTSELPEGLCVRGRGGLIQVTSVRPKKKLKGDDNARQVGQVGVVSKRGLTVHVHVYRSCHSWRCHFMRSY